MVSVLSNGIENLKWSGSIKSVEDEVRRLINARNVRLTEYFKDFDRLRTGFISKNQFDRCLDQLFGVVLSAEEDSLLMEKYGSDPKQKGMVNYRKFCEVIGAVFNPNELQEDPATQSIGVDASAPTDRRPLSPASLSKCDELLRRMAVHYKYHGINIKTCYADFDKHHIGVVTEPQFYRSFPGPPDITDGEVKLLGKKYRDPARPGLCNYYNFHFDIENKQRDLQDEADFTKFAPNQDNNNLGPRGPGTPTLDDIFEKIRVAVFKNGIRTTEFFCDHDKLRSGIITENQFICGLTLCCGSQANLSRNEIQKVVDAFKTDDGRVVYKEFCDMMENTFTLRDLEKQPTADPYRPPVGALAKAPNLLSNAEEARVQEILKGLIDKVRKRRLMVYPYFKDYDRSKGYTRGVTKTQFARLLHFLSLDLQPRELELICKKYEYPVGGDINYPAFSQAIDSEYTGTSTTLGNDAENGRKTSPVPKQRDVDLSTVNPEELIGRIRYHVLVNRLRVEEFFQDFDPLRHGSISKGQFRQCLNSLGLNLTEAQFEVLSLYYEDQKRPGNTMWTRFLTDVEIVFTKRGLEKQPTHEVPAMEAFHMPRPGACNNLQTAEHQQFLQQIMLRMRKKIEQRRILCKPIFQDFDKHNNGHVTKSQARQCLLNLGLTNTEQEMKVIEARYSDDTGFNYMELLEELQPTDKPELMYTKRLDLLKIVNSKEIPDWGHDNLASIMHKIKSKVMKERVRVLEFMKDYDKLRTGRMSRVNFARAMDLSSLGLTKMEVEKIMDAYASYGYPDFINYLQFCDDVEEIFTLKNLEKNPLVTPEQFNTTKESENKKLDDPNAEEMLERVMHRLADRVRIRRVQIFPLFEDYDRVHNGTVSRGQFHRVLSELDLGGLVSTREFTVLYKKFDVIIGLKHDFNYISFCDMINDYANFQFGMP